MDGEVGEGGGEVAEEVGDDVGGLVEVVAVDVGVELFGAAEGGASVENTHHLPLQSPSLTNHVLLPLLLLLHLLQLIDSFSK